MDAGVGVGRSVYGTPDSLIGRGDPLIFSITESGAIIDISLKVA